LNSAKIQVDVYAWREHLLLCGVGTWSCPNSRWVFVSRHFYLKGEIKKYPTIEDVKKYITRNNAQLDIIKNETSCMSFYGLCE